MSGARSLLVGVILAGVLGFAFFHFVVSPKLADRSDLDDQISQKQTELSKAQALLADNVAARADVRRTAAARVRLGTAAPPEDQTAALVSTLTAIAKRSGARFTGLDLAQSTGATTTGTSSDGGDDAAATGLTPQAVTITLSGRYAAIQEALRRMRGLVRTNNGRVRVAGRLIAVDGVTLTLPDEEGETGLGASISARTFTTKGSDTASGTTSTDGASTSQGTTSSSTTSSSSSSGTSSSTGSSSGSSTSGSSSTPTTNIR